MYFFELAEHDIAVFTGLHVAVGGTADEDEPVGVRIDGEGKVGAAEVQHSCTAVFRFGSCLLKNADEVFEHVHACGKKELFLIAVVMGEQAEGNPGAVGYLFERGLGKAVFAEQFFGSLKQRFFFRKVFHTVASMLRVLAQSSVTFFFLPQCI